jgi:hypothetical protein
MTLDRPPHGISRDGSVLYIDESRIRTRHDADKLRGIRANGLVVFRDLSMPLELRTYLENEVLQPIALECRGGNAAR